jgi:hypothetical protein
MDSCVAHSGWPLPAETLMIKILVIIVVVLVILYLAQMVLRKR